jgi:hypothetical protein
MRLTWLLALAVCFGPDGLAAPDPRLAAAIPVI